MKITIERDGLKKLGHKVGTAALDAAEALEAAAGKLKGKAEDGIERSRLMRAMADLEEEMDLQLHAIGELVYATHRGTPSDSDDIQEILEYMDSLQEEMDAHRQQLEVLAGAVVCGACGAANGRGNLYCQNCGRPLPKT